MTTLSDGTTTVVLPDVLDWTDEFSWQPVAQAVDRSIVGKLLIQVAPLSAGRPVTLASDGKAGWIPRSDIDRLAAWASVPGQVLTLSLRGASYSVVFRHQDKAFDVRPVLVYDGVESDDDYIATIRLMTV